VIFEISPQQFDPLAQIRALWPGKLPDHNSVLTIFMDALLFSLRNIGSRCRLAISCSLCQVI
jgi:hypothetical protein